MSLLCTRITDGPGAGRGREKVGRGGGIRTYDPETTTQANLVTQEGLEPLIADDPTEVGP